MDAPVIRVLVVEDHPADARLVVEMLREARGARFDVDVVPRLREAMARLGTSPPDVLLLDLGLPDAGGLEALHRVRREAEQVPTIILSGLDDQEVVARAAEVGAQDYLIKGRFDSELLVRSIRYAIEREKTARTLRESEERFRRLAENAPDIIFRYRLGPDPGFEYVSPAAAAIVGYTPEEHYADPELGLTLVHPEDRGVLSAATQGLLPEKDPVSLRWVHRSGQLIWTEIHSVTIRDRTGRPVALEGIARDVTRRRQAEERLRVQDSALEAVAEAIMITDFGGSILWVNPAFTSLTGYERHEVLGKTPRVLRSGQQDDAFYATLWKTILGGGVWSGRMVNRRRDGTLYTEESTITPVFCDRRRITHFLAVKRDVTQRLKREEALRASERRYRSLFERDLTGVYRATTDGRILVCNEAFARIYGYDSPDELRSGSAWDLHPTEGERERFLADLLARGSLTNHEAAGRHRDGSLLWILENVSLIEGEESGVHILEGTVIDITERKRLEEQLRQAQKMEAIGQLAGGVAHDFNNLLSVITGYSELVLARLGAEREVRAKVEQIRLAAGRATTLTRQLLAFSRKQVVQPVVMDLNAVVADIMPMLRRLIRENIEIAPALSPAPARVLADRGQIEQVITNLAVNAGDAMPEGGRFLIETGIFSPGEGARQPSVGVDPGSHVSLTVSDTGTGMDALTQSHIFEPFFTTKPEGAGTGLGLATVHRIVKENGGHIEVESAPGCGTTFRILLPAARGDEGAGAARPTTPVLSLRGHETILLVEDEEALGALAQELLEDAGYTVLVARNGADALELSARYEKPIHLVVTDVVMPRLGGVGLATQIAVRRPRLPVLYTSGYMADPRLMEPGAPFLPKPYSRDQLVRKVREVLDRVASLDESPPAAGPDDTRSR